MYEFLNDVFIKLSLRWDYEKEKTFAGGLDVLDERKKTTTVKFQLFELENINFQHMKCEFWNFTETS